MEGEIFHKVTVGNIIEQKKLDKLVSKSSKLESIGILAGGIGCDFINKITLILAYISMAKMQIKGDTAILEIIKRIIRFCVKGFRCQM